MIHPSHRQDMMNKALQVMVQHIDNADIMIVKLLLKHWLSANFCTAGGSRLHFLRVHAGGNSRHGHGCAGALSPALGMLPKWWYPLVNIQNTMENG